MSQFDILAAIIQERARQDDKFGPVDHLRLPNGTGDGHAVNQLRYARQDYTWAEEAGTLTMGHILREEFWEAMTESDDDKLRAELIQVAAVCVKWCEIIDARRVEAKDKAWLAAPLNAEEQVALADADSEDGSEW